MKLSERILKCEQSLLGGEAILREWAKEAAQLEAEVEELRIAYNAMWEKLGDVDCLAPSQEMPDSY